MGEQHKSTEHCGLEGLAENCEFEVPLQWAAGVEKVNDAVQKVLDAVVAHEAGVCDVQEKNLELDKHLDDQHHAPLFVPMTEADDVAFTQSSAKDSDDVSDGPAIQSLDVSGLQTEDNLDELVSDKGFEMVIPGHYARSTRVQICMK
ncbi:unnamed protein product [Calypogeia fissa]